VQLSAASQRSSVTCTEEKEQNMQPLKEARMYDIQEYAEKVRASLVRLKQQQKPGELIGKGGKTEVLQAAKSEIQALLKEGYSSKQIADALQGDVFGILPKTITQLFASVRKPKRVKQTAQQEMVRQDTPPAVRQHKQITEPGSFRVKDDSDDL
jgi:hypothetical protein